MKIIITGGHHNSALEVVHELKKHGKQNFLWLGHKHTIWGDRSESAEYREVTAAGIPFVELKAGKLYKTFHPIKLARIPFGFLQALYQVARFKPNLILSFGGYVAVPVVLAAKIWRIPVVTHEQTTTVGWANRLIAKLADKIFVTWPASLRHFPASKVVLVGLPLRKAIFKKSKKDKILFIRDLPTIYITGGKQGSHLINEAVKGALPQLLEKYNLIHQCGAVTTTGDYQELQKARASSPENLKQGYELRDYVFEDEIGMVFAAADLVVGRAGAHIIYELAALQKPALLIPIPWVSHNEQYKNVRVLMNLGMAKILPEDELSSAALIKETDEMIANLAEYQQKAQKARELIRLDAAPRMAQEILALAG